MDYRFALRCWQDKAGSENAKANVFVNGAQVLTNAEVTSTSQETPTILNWESTGLAAPNKDGSVTVDIKVVLTNEYYVDASTDRNIHIDGIGYIDKADGSNYIANKKGVVDDDTLAKMEAGSNDAEWAAAANFVTVTDFTDWTNYQRHSMPTKVEGDQIPTDFWSSRDDATQFYTITVWGDYDGDEGVTITHPLDMSAKGYVYDGS